MKYILISIFTLISLNVKGLELTLSQGTVKPTPIAITNLYSNDASLDKLGENISTVISDNLERSGLFISIDKKAFIQSSQSLSKQPRFEDWKVLKAQHLVAGKIESNGNKISIHLGPALQSLEQMKSDSFDMAFIDADKANYLEYYMRCLSLVKQGGAIILDNMLWSGTVIDPKDDDAKALRKTGDYIQNDKRVFNTLLTIRDGLMLCIKK